MCTNNREISPPGKKQVHINGQDFVRSYSICSTADAKVVDWTGLSWNRSKDLDEDHPAVRKISSIGIHAALALEVEADRVLFGLNDATSIPAEDITVRIHLDKVSFEIALCGLVKLRNN